MSNRDPVSITVLLPPEPVVAAGLTWIRVGQVKMRAPRAVLIAAVLQLEELLAISDE